MVLSTPDTDIDPHKGIPANHAYSILNVHEVPDGAGTCVVEVRVWYYFICYDTNSA